MMWFEESQDEEVPVPVISDRSTSSVNITNLQRAREEAGLSQSELADALGVSQPYISACEAGRKTLADKHAVALFRALKRGHRRRMRDRTLMRRILDSRDPVAQGAP